MKKTLLQIALVTAMGLSATAVMAAGKVAPKAFLETYATIAHSDYSDALKDAKALQAAIHAFTQNPTADTLQAAKDAWLQSRETYGETEIYRLSQGPIDAEEGWIEKTYGNREEQLNAWPLDENLIDYTVDAKGERTHGNIIDTTGTFTPGGEDPKPVDVSNITKDTITELNQNGGEANVASGYHAIEFLLWGQDQDYNNFIEDKVTHGAMVAGQRPLTDFTTDKFAKRRLDYLNATVDKLVDDLAVVNSAWEPKVDGNNGLFRAALLDKLTGSEASKNIPVKQSLKDIFVGMGMFIKSELANERIAVAVLTPSEEDEHSCFSDNTHRDIAQNYQGFKDVLLGEYHGKKVGPAPFDALSADKQAKVKQLMSDIEKRIATVNELAKTKMHFDYQIHPENETSVNNIVALKNDLRRLGDMMVDVAAAFNVSLTTNDVTDSEENHDYEK